ACGMGVLRTHRSALFFFQAEDGIRARNVTGVQTCALPISPLIVPVLLGPQWTATIRPMQVLTIWGLTRGLHAPHRAVLFSTDHRSEERRVGKECRCSRATARCRNARC